MAIAVFIAVAASPSSAPDAGAKDSGTEHHSTARVSTVSETCPFATLAVGFYRGRYLQHQLERGAGLHTWRKPRSCADAHYLTKVWEKRARLSRVATARW